MRTEGEGLRRCPTCGTKASEAELGLRDYRWLGDALPGRVGGMDIDFLLDNGKAGTMLALEFKPCGAFVSAGARRTFSALRKRGIDVWVVRDCGDEVEWVELDTYGEELAPMRGNRQDLALAIGDWWNGE